MFQKKDKDEGKGETTKIIEKDTTVITNSTVTEKPAEEAPKKADSKEEPKEEEAVAEEKPVEAPKAETAKEEPAAEKTEPAPASKETVVVVAAPAAEKESKPVENTKVVAAATPVVPEDKDEETADDDDGADDDGDDGETGNAVGAVGAVGAVAGSGFKRLNYSFKARQSLAPKEAQDRLSEIINHFLSFDDVRKSDSWSRVRFTYKAKRVACLRIRGQDHQGLLRSRSQVPG